MRSRIVAGAILAASGAVAWAAAEWSLGARAVEVGIAGLAAFVVFIGWRGGRTIRAARGRPGLERRRGMAGAEEAPPFVTVVVPAKDEASVIEQIVCDLGTQDYDLEGVANFEVLVVDDGSRDGTGRVARCAAARFGGLVRVLRREPDGGPVTRGAALDFATPYASGTVIAAVDADARVASDFLTRAVHAWTLDPGAAALQVQRRPVNEERSWLTRAQTDELRGDMAPQSWRWTSDGTAELRGNGMFIRRDVLERLGGWGARALTEDLDTSTRLAASGERVAVAPAVVVGEQAVESLVELWHQRMRWAEGSIRRLVAHAPTLLRAPIPLGRKLNCLVFGSEFVVPPLLVASVSASVARVSTGAEAAWDVPLSLFLGYEVALVALVLAGVGADGRHGVALLASCVRSAVYLTHWLLVVPVALTWIALGPGTVRYRKALRPTAERRLQVTVERLGAAPAGQPAEIHRPERAQR